MFRVILSDVLFLNELSIGTDGFLVGEGVSEPAGQALSQSVNVSLIVS